MSANSVPYAGIVVTLAICAIGVLLNYLVPGEVFELGLNLASLGVLSTWAFILVCQIRFRQAVARGDVPDVTFRMPGSPASSWITLGFLACVLVLMGFDYPTGTWTVAMIPLVTVLLFLGWRALAANRREFGMPLS